MSFLSHVPLLGNEAIDGLIRQAQWNDAEELLLRMLRESELTLRPDHSDTQKVKVLLAHVYRQEGRFHDAEPLDLAVLATRERLLGADAQDTLVTMHNLAVDIKMQPSRLMEGLALERRVLETAVQLYWSDETSQQQRQQQQQQRSHDGSFLSTLGMDILRRLCNLADTFFMHDAAADAARLHENVLRYCTASIGPGHPYTIAVMDSTGRDYVALGRLREAVRLLYDAVEAGRVHLGERDATTQRCLVHLAETYGRLTAEGDGRVPEPHAIATLEHAVRILEESVRAGDADDDTDIISLKYYLAVAYARVDGRFADSEALQEQVLQWCHRQFGVRTHIAKLMIRNLVLMYRQLGRMDKARIVENEFGRLTGRSLS
jgi:hypothetical protein